jgi:hypothetical protein
MPPEAEGPEIAYFRLEKSIFSTSSMMPAKWPAERGAGAELYGSCLAAPFLDSDPHSSSIAWLVRDSDRNAPREQRILPKKKNKALADFLKILAELRKLSFVCRSEC